MQEPHGFGCRIRQNSPVIFSQDTRGIFFIMGTKENVCILPVSNLEWGNVDTFVDI